MDDADLAQQMTEVYESAALSKQRVFQPVAGGRAWLTCEDCGRPIPLKRMQANPGATRCIKCQTILEESGT